ncbi:MAG: DUF951 domain-containing protein [Bacilli bacterium]
MYKFEEGDIVTLKKGHPCGSYKWKLLKNGVEVTIECVGCGRIVKIKRTEFNRRIKQIEKAGEINEE